MERWLCIRSGGVSGNGPQKEEKTTIARVGKLPPLFLRSELGCGKLRSLFLVREDAP